METGTQPIAPEKKCCQNDGKKPNINALTVAGAIVLGSLIVASAILFAANPKSATAPTGEDDTLPVAQADPADTNATTSLDDDAVLGDKSKAKVAIVEYSDYECPFCKRFHQETFDKLVKEFVDTGKAVISFRDFPLSFHDPVASKEAALAECVRKEKGDKAYFSFGQALYANTQTNGKGVPAGKLDELIGKAGANPKTVNACAETDAIKEEIQKDFADGQKAGISGTPSFVIGVLGEDGSVKGEKIVGAVPFETFKTTVEKYSK